MKKTFTQMNVTQFAIMKIKNMYAVKKCEPSNEIYFSQGLALPSLFHLQWNGLS